MRRQIRSARSIGTAGVERRLNDLDLSAVAPHGFARAKDVLGVIPAFDIQIRLPAEQQRQRAVFLHQRHRIDCCQARDHVHPLALREQSASAGLYIGRLTRPSSRPRSGGRKDSRAAARYWTWPACSRSKLPQVKPIRRPAAFWAATHSSICSSERILHRGFPWSVQHSLC